MFISLARSCGAAVVLVASAQGALADLSAQDVWSDWKSYMAGVGYEFTATEELAGNRLTVSDITLILPVPEQDDVTAALSMGDIAFVENGDGSVNILLPRDFPMTVLASEGSDKLKVDLRLTHDGSPVLVSGDPRNMTYTYATSQMTLLLDNLESTDKDIPEGAIDFSATLSDLATRTEMSMSDNRHYTQNWTAGGMAYDVAVKDPGSDDHFSATGALRTLAAQSTSTIPAQMNRSGDIAALLQRGFSTDARFSYSGGNSAIAFENRGETFNASSSSGGGSFNMVLSADHLSYGISLLELAVTLAGSEIPGPLSLSMAEAGLNISMPLAKSEEEQDFALGVALRDFSVPDLIWGMIDPAGALPRDPASAVLSLTGKGKVLFDIFDPEAIERVEDGDMRPGELNAVTIQELLVSAAGAKLTGTGDFTFNNEDLVSFNGLPAPAGEANLTLSGANALIDKLIDMGLISDNDAMGARMMMGMLAVPGDGADTLNSKIEITEDGKVLANGQRLK